MAPLATPEADALPNLNWIVQPIETVRVRGDQRQLTIAENPRTLRLMQDTVSLTEFLNGHMPDALELLRQMVGINSFTSNRDGVNRLGRSTADCFAPLGFKAKFVPSANPDYGDHLVLTRQ